MADLVLETGSGVVGANSYADVAFANDYFSGHPFLADAWTETDSVKRAGLLIWGSQQIDLQFNWYGRRSTANQGMDWPRVGVRDRYDVLISQNVVPLRVKQAACEMAFFLTKGDPFAPPASAGLEELRIDVIDLKFGGSVAPRPVPPAALALLRGLGEYAFGSRVRRVIVG